MTGSLIAPLGDEMLDHPDADPEAVVRSLNGIARANLWFGGWWAVRRGLELVARRRPSGLWEPQATRPRGSPLGLGGDRAALGSRRRPGREGVLQGSAAGVSMLDVGCGRGDLTRRAVAWGARRGLTIIPIGLERHRMAARLTRREGIAALLGCAGALPVRDKSVDIVIASQLLHHLSEAASIAFCQAADRIARHGVVIADLRRSPWALAAFQLGARLIALDRVTRLDGLTSIRRGFTRAGLARLLAAAGVDGRVEYTPGFRVVATWIPRAR